MKEKDDPMFENELLGMTPVTDKTTGIEGVVIWIGPNPRQNVHRIWVSNRLNSYKASDRFNITIPELEITSVPNNVWIGDSILESLKTFIKINLQVILEYSEKRISTEELLGRLIKV